MVKYSKQRMQRRKLERKETTEIVQNYAHSLGMEIINSSGIQPQNLEAALLLLLDAREQLPPDDENALIISQNESARISFMLCNAPRCPDCGSLMVCVS